MDHADAPHPRQRIATLTVVLAAAWVAAGALFKLFAGSPNDLPASVRGALGDAVLTFRIAIAVELCIVIFALLRPHLGWIPLAALFVVFDLVLAPLVAEGAASCGCFGSKVPIPPWAMMAIDSGLLLAMLATRPWRSFARRALRPLPLVPLFAIAIASPWYFFRTAAPKVPVRGTAAADPASAAGTADAATPAVDATNGDPAVTVEPELEAVVPEPQVAEGFCELRPGEWIGQSFESTDLAKFLTTDWAEVLPPDCRIVIYRQTCEHCERHLKALAEAPPEGEMLVLLRIPDPGDTPENELTTIKPEAVAMLELQMLERGYGGIVPPAELRVETFVITDVQEGLSHDG